MESAALSSEEVEEADKHVTQTFGSSAADVPAKVILPLRLIGRHHGRSRQNLGCLRSHLQTECMTGMALAHMCPGVLGLMV